MSNASDFIINNGILKKYVGPGGDVVIPEGVTAIDYWAFHRCSSLSSVVIPEGFKSIGNHAFSGCDGLSGVVIPESLTSIGDYAFEKCSRLGNLVIPEGILFIGRGAFSGCSGLSSVVIPAGVKSIGGGMFEKCSGLNSVVIPESVTSIGSNAFRECRSLSNVVIPEGVTSIGDQAFDGCSSLTSVVLPTHLASFIANAKLPIDAVRIRTDELSELPAKYRICAALCFAEDGGLREDPRFESYGKYLKANAGKIVEIAIRNTALLALLCREKWIPAKNIEAYQIAVQQSKDVELIAMLLDYQNNKLTAKEKENTLKQKQRREDTVLERRVARMAQKGISGLNFVVTGDVYTFHNREELKSLVESKGGKLLSSMSPKIDYLIMNDAPKDSPKKKKAVELGIEIISERQFNDMAGRSFEIENGILTKYLGSGGDVVIPEGVKSIGNGAFYCCENLSGVVIPETVTSIGDSAFEGCRDLSSVVIPEGVTSIGNNVCF